MEYPQLDVIAVGAHPDDVEIGCGGCLARLAQQGYRFGIVDLTDGEPTPRSPGPEARLAEAQELGFKQAFLPASTAKRARSGLKLRGVENIAALLEW